MSFENQKRRTLEKYIRTRQKDITHRRLLTIAAVILVYLHKFYANTTAAALGFLRCSTGCFHLAAIPL